jgi:hypothetical protein
MEFRDKPINPTQLKKARERLCREYPLNLRVDLDCCSYAARRAGPGVLALLNVTGILRNAFGNWKEATEVMKERSHMPDNYTENKLQVSFKSKFLVNESIRRTVMQKNSVDFQWGELSQRSPETEEILALSGAMAMDVKLPSRESNYSRLELVTGLDADDFLDEKKEQFDTLGNVVPPVEKTPLIGPGEDYDVEEPLAESEGTSDSDSNTDIETTWHNKEFAEYSAKKLVAGKSATTWVHVIRDDDTDSRRNRCARSALRNGRPIC